MKFDTPNITINPQQQKYDNHQKEYSNNPKLDNKEDIKGKDYFPTSIDEEWESKLLFWSKKKKVGYIYSPKKDAWYKSKN